MSIPVHRDDLLKWNGWGYKDSFFFINSDGDAEFTGNRYKIGNTVMPNLTKLLTEQLGCSLEDKRVAQNSIEIPQRKICEDFTQQLDSIKLSYSIDDHDRLFRSHGHTLEEIYKLRYGKIERIPDIVLFPTQHQQIVDLVKMAEQFNVVLIPFGGGTNVTKAVSCEETENRLICSVDTSQMNKILWINENNLTCRVQSGIIGQDLERSLELKGFCTGHEPDSYEFSSVGGWISTRASGMKKNRYGNIEDIVVHFTIATTKGVMEYGCVAPRLSANSDIHQIFLGHEGTLGIITEATLKIRPLPKYRRYGSIVFPDFDQGIDFMREVAKEHCAPSSVRLMDHEQFLFGQSLKAKDDSIVSNFVDGMKKLYVNRWKGINLQTICAATLLFEDDSIDEIRKSERTIYGIAKKFNGFAGGEENGERGYQLTFAIAYLRDIGLDYQVVSESFETSCPWDCVKDLCGNVKKRLMAECRKHKLEHDPYISCRVTQVYDVGAVIYFYFAFNGKGVENPIDVYEEIEHSAREEILENGGCISHHHGVGKIRQRFLPDTVGQVGIDILKGVKNDLDPTNIFAANNGAYHLSSVKEMKVKF
ncbi:hypothetical protein SNEBB_006652 [Seison nebaliae]|nr:hypothetical protein SNEBB_006652 [Seison nebaliae]